MKSRYPDGANIETVDGRVKYRAHAEGELPSEYAFELSGQWSTFRTSGGAYVPEHGRLRAGPPDELRVRLGGEEFSVSCALEGGSCSLTARGPGGGEHALMLRLKSGEGVRTRAGEFVLGEESIAAETGGLVSCDRWEIVCPEESTFEWPLRPFNPYAKDGAAREGQEQARLCSPLGEEKNYRISPRG